MERPVAGTEGAREVRHRVADGRGHPHGEEQPGPAGRGESSRRAGVGTGRRSGLLRRGGGRRRRPCAGRCSQGGKNGVPHQALRSAGAGKSTACRNPCSPEYRSRCPDRMTSDLRRRGGTPARRLRAQGAAPPGSRCGRGRPRLSLFPLCSSRIESPDRAACSQSVSPSPTDALSLRSSRPARSP